MIKATKTLSANDLMKSACNMLACMLAVKKVALLLIYKDNSMLQYESDISEYQTFDMSVVTRLWFSKPRADQATLALNPMLDNSNNLSVEELRLAAPWIKCLKVMSLKTDSEGEGNFPQILVCLLDTRASKLNRKLADEWFFARQLIKNIVHEAVCKNELNGKLIQFARQPTNIRDVTCQLAKKKY